MGELFYVKGLHIKDRKGIVGVARELRDLQYGRKITSLSDPMEVEYAETIDEQQQFKQEYQTEVRQYWNDPGELLGLVLGIHDEYWVNSDLFNDPYGDSWDGRPNDYVTSEDIKRMCRKYDVPLNAYYHYYNLSMAERKLYRENR